MQWLGILFMAALLVIAPGYGRAQQAKDTPAAAQPQGPAVQGGSAGMVKSFTPEERQAYEKQTAEELDAIQKKISDIRVNAATGAPQNKRLLIQAANNLQMQQLVAVDELKVLKKASGSAWGPQKIKMDQAMAQLRKNWEPGAAHSK
jgi:hypothetical protein